MVEWSRSALLRRWTAKTARRQNPGVDTLVLTPVDALTVKFTTTLKGEVVYIGVRTLSADGQTMTLWTKGINPGGQAIRVDHGIRQTLEPISNSEYEHGGAEGCSSGRVS